MTGVQTCALPISCTPMFIAALFIKARTWKQPRCPSADEWTKICADLPWYTPGDLGQDLLDADDELLVLGGVALDGAVQPGHVEVQGAERGRFAGAWGGRDPSDAKQGCVLQCPLTGLCHLLPLLFLLKFHAAGRRRENQSQTCLPSLDPPYTRVFLARMRESRNETE